MKTKVVCFGEEITGAEATTLKGCLVDNTVKTNFLWFRDYIFYDMQ
jgi:hypothetical protein